MKLFLFPILLLYSQSSFAQQNQDDAFKRFGLFAGVNVSNMNFNKGFPTPAVKIPAAWKAGITIGFRMQVPLSEKLSLQPEYAYTHRKGSDKSIAVDYSTDYLSLPVLLKYNVSHLLALVAGPEAELLIFSRASASGTSSSITHEMEERSIGATAGLDVRLNQSFVLSARYLYGLNHVGIRQQSGEKEFKYEVVNVTVGFDF